MEGPVSTVISAHRPYAQGEFKAAEVRLFAALIPHLQRAAQLQQRFAGLDGPPEGSAEILDRLLQGVLLVDADARVIFANRAAEALVRTGRGLLLGRDGLRAEIPAETQRLRRLITDCAKPRGELGGAGGRLPVSREQGLPLIVLVAPHHSQFTWIDVLRPRAILFVTDPGGVADMRRKWLLEDFGLTRSEAAVAVEILEADGLQAVADRLGVSLATARTDCGRCSDA